MTDKPENESCGARNAVDESQTDLWLSDESQMNIDELQRIGNAATKGPWKQAHETMIIIPYEDIDDYHACDTEMDKSPLPLRYESNAKFIVTARNHWDAILAEAERAREIIRLDAKKEPHNRYGKLWDLHEENAQLTKRVAELEMQLAIKESNERKLGYI